MKHNILGSTGVEYTVDTEAITCTCPRFKFHCKNFGVNDPNRLCKHIKQVFQDFPPSHCFIESNNEKDLDGKIRYPREKFESYVKRINHIVDAFEFYIRKMLICGSWRRLNDRISDLDVLLVMKDEKSFKYLQDYIEEMYSPVIRWKGDVKATYVFDEFCQIDFKVVEEKHWPFATMHFTGSKEENIRLRKVATSMGYSLSEYGICDNIESDENLYKQFDCKSEENVYKFLNQKYKKPEER